MPPQRMNSRGKIHIVWITTGLGSGGAEMVLFSLIAAADPARFRHSVISLTPGGKYEGKLRERGIEVTSLGMRPGRPGPIALFRLALAIRRISPDVLMGWMYHGAFAALLARRISFRSVPVIANVRQSLDSLANEKRGSAMVIRMLSVLSSQFSAIVYNSRRSADQHESLGYDRSRRVIIPNGVDTQSFAPSTGARAALRHELGLPEDALLVGRIGRNHPMKDYPSFLKAADLVSRENSAVHFVLAGAGVERSDAMLAECLEKMSAPERVHLLGERHDLPRLTSSLDIACSSSAFGEGFPNIIAEAMACGICCVATDVGDSARLLGEEGRVVPPKDSSEMARAILAWLQWPPESRASIGERLRRRAAMNFSFDAALEKFARLWTRDPCATGVQPEENPCAA
ncbi:MAG TPA: glycosyltransferase [Verrucomicrobiaceae bacterium]